MPMNPETNPQLRASTSMRRATKKLQSCKATLWRDIEREKERKRGRVYEWTQAQYRGVMQLCSSDR